jgi:hypothetical protein
MSNGFLNATISLKKETDRSDAHTTYFFGPEGENFKPRVLAKVVESPQKSQGGLDNFAVKSRCEIQAGLKSGTQRVPRHKVLVGDSHSSHSPIPIFDVGSSFTDCKGEGKETYRPPDMHWRH